MFEYQAKIIINRGFRLTWESIGSEKKKRRGARGAQKNKIKYTCPGCAANAWGKPGLHLLCLVCDEPLVRVKGQDDTTG
jgi:hypothetical protein